MEFKSLFKLSALSLLIAAPVTTALAQEVYTPCSFCGFTLGLGLGASTLMTDVKTSALIETPIDVSPPDLTIQTPVINSISTASDANVYKYGPMASLFAGYGLVFDNHSYLGANLGVNFYGSNKSKLPHATTETHYDIYDGVVESTLTRSVDVQAQVTRNSVEPFMDVKLGFLTTPTALVYVRGGINYNKFKLKSTTNYQASGEISAVVLQPPVPVEHSYSLVTSKSKSELGYRAGIGMEVMVTPSFGIGADYIYSFYPRVKFNATSAVNDVFCDGSAGCSVLPSTQTTTAKANISDQQILAQLIYHFGV